MSKEEAFGKLEALLGNRFTTSVSVRNLHGRGEGHVVPKSPEAVCFPETTGEVAAIAKICHTARIPMIAEGAGSSFEGQVAALNGGVGIVFTRMNQVVDLNAADLDVTVQAGITREELNAYLRDTGLFFPVDPGANATIGGMAATRASGTNAVRYGTMRENVLSLTVVLVDGTVIKTSQRARKSAAGYDLTHLFVGSAGTLGLITEVTVRLYGRPEAEASGICQFECVAAAVEVVMQAIQMGIPLSRIELLDAPTIDLVESYSRLGLSSRPSLFIEFQGSPLAVDEQIQQMTALCRDAGGSDIEFSADAEARTQLWKARHDAHYAMLASRAGSKVWGTDACVPVSRLAECIEETRRDIADAPFFVGIIGHVGDGNFHLGMVIDPLEERELALAEQINDRLVRRTIEMGGTCTGEHGIGYGKTKYMPLEFGPAVQVMASVKAALDPHNLLNPGKILPKGASSG